MQIWLYREPAALQASIFGGSVSGLHFENTLFLTAGVMTLPAAMAECRRMSLTEVTGQSLVSRLNLWVVEVGLSWDDSFSCSMHYHCAIPVVGPHCSQQHTLLGDTREDVMRC